MFCYSLLARSSFAKAGVSAASRPRAALEIYPLSEVEGYSMKCLQACFSPAFVAGNTPAKLVAVGQGFTIDHIA
jgi:hypothetical protein